MLHSSLLVSSGRCGSFLSSSVRTPSAELTVQTAFLSACSFCTLSPHAASIFGDEERLCMSALLWKVKVDSYRKFFNACRGDDEAEKTGASSISGIGALTNCP
ncbi:hypothetical protein PS2_033363 [Malus domestica]